METYKKPIIMPQAVIKGIIPLAAVATTATEVAVGVAAVLGFLTGLGDKDFHPEHSLALTVRKDFSFA